MSITSQQTRLNLANLGEAMKNVALWSLISLLLFFLVVPEIILFVYWIIFLKKLRNAAFESGDQNLRSFYSNYIWSVLIVVIMVPILIGIFVSTFFGFMPLPDYPQFPPYTNSMPMMGGFYGGMMMSIMVVFFVLLIIPVVLLIKAYIAFETFAKKYAASVQNNMAVTDLVDGSQLMKIGAFLSIVPGLDIIGFIMQLVGINKSGNGLVREFSSQLVPNVETSIPRSQTSPISQVNTINPEILSSQTPTAANFCANCGSKLDPNGKFCAICGQKIQP